jgi:hypothetical protein
MEYLTVWNLLLKEKMDIPPESLKIGYIRAY